MDKQYFDIAITFKLKPGMKSDNTYYASMLRFEEANQLVKLLWLLHKDRIIDLQSIRID